MYFCELILVNIYIHTTSKYTKCKSFKYKRKIIESLYTDDI